MQNLFNLADQRSLDVLAECADRDIAFVLARSRRRVESRLPRWPHGCAHAAPGRPRLAARPRTDILLIPATRTRDHLAENLGTAGVDLDDAARAERSPSFPSH